MNQTHKADLKDARYLLKEAVSAGAKSREAMLHEARDIIEQVIREGEK